jgi:hypothetical protein
VWSADRCTEATIEGVGRLCIAGVGTGYLDDVEGEIAANICGFGGSRRGEEESVLMLYKTGSGQDCTPTLKPRMAVLCILELGLVSVVAK